MKATEPVVAIVGRPNAGKSTLFNRLVGRRQAIVDRESGITRDRIYTRLVWREKSFRLVDTGGIDLAGKDQITRQVRKQAQTAIAEARLILLVLDVRTGITALDEEVAGLLRRSGKPVIPVVNKIDNEKLAEDLADFHRLGMGEPLGISALHGLGVGELRELITENLDATAAAETPWETEAIRVAVVGRPNVGKSSFVNHLLQEERVIVDDQPGTTRDSVDVAFEENGRKFIIVDTAGLRRRRKLKKAVEFFSVDRAQRSIAEAQVVIVILDGLQGLQADDVRVIGYVQESEKPVVIAVNKWDLVDRKLEPKHYEEALRRRLKFMYPAPVLFTSCVTGKNVVAVIRTAAEVKKLAETRFHTGLLNRAVAEAMAHRPPPLQGRRPPRIFYVTQTGVLPLEFLVFVNHRKLFKDDYVTFLENFLRRRLGLDKVPVRIELRERKREDDT